MPKSSPKRPGKPARDPKGFAERADQMTKFAVFDQPRRARALLQAEPALGTATFYAACATGAFKYVAQALAKQPKLAVTNGGPNQWPPILYACFSDLFRTDKKSAPRFLRVVRLLLAHGADPNAAHLHDGKFPLSALYGAAGRANNAQLTRLLLEAGANPNDGESLYHSTEFRDHACTRLLLKFGAKFEGTNAVHRQLDFDDLAGFKLLLDAGADPNLRSHLGDPLLHGAITRGRGVAFLKLLADRGADLQAKNRAGATAFQIAAGHGYPDAVKFLQARGAGEVLAPRDLLIAACASGDTRTVNAMRKQQPQLMKSLTAGDLGLLSDFAWRGKLASVRLMLKAGFTVAAPNPHGATALHSAAWKGDLPIVKVLLAAGAPVEVTEPCYHATPLGWALHGSVNARDRAGHPHNPKANYPSVVRALLAAGARRPKAIDEALPGPVCKVLAK